MIIKKTVMTSLLILAFIWQGTSLYGMHRFVARKSTGFLSKKLSNLMTRRSYCDSSKKRTDTIEDLRKEINILNKYTDSLKKDTVFLKERLCETDNVIVVVWTLSAVTCSGLCLHIAYHMTHCQ